MTNSINIRPAGPDDRHALAEAFYSMWIDNSMKEDDFIPDWKEKTLAFMADAEHHSQGRAFVASADGVFAGGAQCLVSRKLYPQALKPDVRKDGYIWGVYVNLAYRRTGLATKLTDACIAYLRDIGCTRAVLHASPTGKPVYAALGFHETNEMRLELAA